MSKTQVVRANIILFGMLAGLVALVGAATWDRLSAARASRGWVDHTYEVLNAIRDMQITVREAETDERGYLLTGRDSFLQAYDAALARNRTLLATLRTLTADNPGQQALLESLGPAWDRRVGQFRDTIAIRRAQGLAGVAGAMTGTAGHETMQSIEQTIAAMSEAEQSLLTERLAAAGDHAAWVQQLVIASTLIAVLAMIVAARMLTKAYERSRLAEADQRTLATRLQASLDSLSLGVAVFGPRRRLRHWNERFQSLLGLPASLVASDTPYAALASQPAADGAPVLREDEPVGPARQAVVAYERTLGDGRLVEIRRTPTPEGGFVLTVTDMTERARSEAALREAQKMQAIGQLTGGIAHDFNNLLTVVMGNLELARGKLDAGHPLQGHLDRSLWAAQRGGTLTAQLLAFARKQPLAPASVDLSALLPKLVPLLRRTLGEHIDIRFVAGAGLWPAMTDPAQLEIAVLNLALNARDAMAGGGRLTIELANIALDDAYARTHAEVTPGEYVMVAVSDTGHGMTPDIVARVFEPFFTTKAEGQGTGLGLAMVFGFVKQSGGHIKVYSEPGEGTCVKVYLPRASGAAEALPPRGPAEEVLPRGSATILLVEDEAGVREIAVATLRELGYRVLEAADGEEALQVFDANAPAVDLLLTDVVLPGKVRGREVAERITAKRSGVKVLYMSGYTENSIVHHGRLDDGVQLLGKPFKRDQLARKVADVLGAAAAAGD